MQCVADSWRNTMSSAASIALSAFFAENVTQYPNDDTRQKFAIWYLDRKRFAYKTADGQDHTVSHKYLSTFNLLTPCAFQKWKGMLRGPLVIQTFAAHYTAVSGVLKVLGVEDPNSPLKKPTGGLGLAAAAVSDIFT